MNSFVFLSEEKLVEGRPNLDGAIEFYRYRDVWGWYGDDQVKKIHLDIYVSVKETKCGYWIVPKDLVSYSFDNILDDERLMKKEKKWISKDSKKRFAYPTKKEALYNFKKRKEKQVHIMSRQLEGVLEASKKAEFLEMQLKSGLTEEQIKMCKHTLGIDSILLGVRNMISTRNYYNSGYESNDGLDKLVELGLMSKRETSKEQGGIYYHMTEKGIDTMKMICGRFEAKYD